MECGASADRLVTDRQTALMIRAAAGQGKGQGRADNARALKIFGVYIRAGCCLSDCLSETRFRLRLGGRFIIVCITCSMNSYCSFAIQN